MPLAASAATIAALGAKAALETKPIFNQRPDHTPRLVEARYQQVEARDDSRHHRHLTRAEWQRIWLANWVAKQITPTAWREWGVNVHLCEEPAADWHIEGVTYSGGIGESNVNWRAYGGSLFSSTAGGATPKEQIYVAERIIEDNQAAVPDQHGCNPGGW